jgi:hypothetical protein
MAPRVWASTVHANTLSHTCAHPGALTLYSHKHAHAHAHAPAYKQTQIHTHSFWLLNRRLDLVTQLNEIEARNEDYPETIAFVRLLNSLIAASLLRNGALSRCECVCVFWRSVHKQASCSKVCVLAVCAQAVILQ